MRIYSVSLFDGDIDFDSVTSLLGAGYLPAFSGGYGGQESYLFLLKQDAQVFCTYAGVDVSRIKTVSVNEGIKG